MPAAPAPPWSASPGRGARWHRPCPPG